MNSSTQQCAAELLDVVPQLMRVIRANVHRRSGPELAVPQLRALAFIGQNRGATLSDVAGFLGLTLPSTSKLVEKLVVARLARRSVDSSDRRRVSLVLTATGEKKYAAALAFARAFLAGRIAHLSAPERNTLSQAMHILHHAFADEASELETVPQSGGRNGKLHST